MNELQEKEQVLMAYYAQYYKGASLEEIQELDRSLSQGIGEEQYKKAMGELKEQGLIHGLDTVEERNQDGVDSPMATNEGMLYINDVLNLQSDAVEDHQLDYLAKHLETSHLELTLEPVKTYIESVVKEQADEKPNDNTP
ncbi:MULTISPECIES: hypothetical protein [unclassified Planococcus (in: firmicutes)]|uniref:hypothetical protein n=1 Tax=Planococcus TaxID=1372 RepID=UPI000C320236|nr:MULTISPECIES: hypothetical protein [unclassified Planococcus (in: firmicutes)]AUD12887.1 hypothetical protein CW734_03355 [Planococcus sp. MB-3u-03]PKG47507.1 hypothetical protein CXF66_03460 [Planococcus sp. Urea-trap-24]PKG88169.1 hypothetical protein CXF91_12805 [Planococcus sp. Urea-3u-39]PKH36906.1 hypothetical protein CXF77_13405 [Planococcus sp. MB-3u-09]